ncbi:MAG: response regulator [Clostridiales bacterium]|jgi:PleD family two-component response regulator|nr:response regulator [Clostridiales bacterium]
MPSQYVKKINSLFLPFKVDVEAIHLSVNRYIDRIDSETERLERSYNSGSTTEYCGALTSIQNMLQAISAKRHEAYTVTLMRSSDRGADNYTGKILQQAIADFMLLSIEMQKAQSNAPSILNAKVGAAEKAEESSRNLTAVMHYIDAQDYDRAVDFVAEIANRGTNVGRIAELINSKEYLKASEHASVLKREYEDIVNAVAKEKSNKAVLAVDDRPEILTSISSALRMHFKTLGAPSGKIALDILGQQEIGLFILDIDMPEMDGFTLASRIRGTSGYANTPIMFLTANSSRERIMKAINLGACDFIVKPAYNETILSKVKKYME